MMINLKDVDHNPTVRKLDFDETMIEWHNLAGEALDVLVEEHGEGVRTYVTSQFLEGIGQRVNIAHIPSVKILDKALVKEYREQWNKTAFQKDGKGKWVIPFDKKLLDNTAVLRVFAITKECG